MTTLLIFILAVVVSVLLLLLGLYVRSLKPPEPAHFKPSEELYPFRPAQKETRP